MIEKLASCTRVDAVKLERQIRSAASHAPQPSTDASRVETLKERIEAAAARCEARRQSRPSPTYDPALPVVASKDTIADAIRNNQVVVLCGETGSGKSTQLPKMCLDPSLMLELGIRGSIAHTQPRRIAARAVASRVAEELNVPLGDVVGYKVRFEQRTSERTLLNVVTDGVLLAETRTDPDLLAYDAIIIDEAHERSLTIDFLIGYLHRLLPRRPDLRLIITSATIDPAGFADHFAKLGFDVPVLQVSGRTYPVEVRYHDEPAGSEQDLAMNVALAAEELQAELPHGDVLVFLPGEREIRDAAHELRARNLQRTEILPLYARLSLAEQQRALTPGPPEVRRIVLATNVAETSLTVPGVRAVIDSGLARISRYSTRRKVQLLPIEPVSQASLSQRSGRCGRVGPGICVRLFDEPSHDSREPFTPPEIQRSNLASVILQMKAFRLGEPESFPFLDAPDPRAIRDGYDTLLEIGATDEDRQLTKLGRAIARFPIDPRIARMILAASDEGCLDEMLIVASALETQDPRVRPSESSTAADEAHEQFADERSDFVALINLWKFIHQQKDKLSASKFKKACSQNFLSWLRIREWTNTHRQLRDQARELKLKPGSAGDDIAPLHRSLLSGLLSSIGKKTETPEYAGPRNLRFHIHPASSQFGTKPSWVVSAELVRTTKLYARTVARVQPEWIERAGEHLVKKSYSEPAFSRETGRVEASERATIFGLELRNAKRVDFGKIEPQQSRELFIHSGLVEGELRSGAPFMKHNRRLIEHVEGLEAKARRRDLLADSEARFRFYDERLPEDVNSGQTLDRWRKVVERDQAKLLFMTESDAMAGDASDITSQRFPDAFKADGGVVIPLKYRHDPGAPTDGVSAKVRVDDLPRIGSLDAERAVPGLLYERIEVAIKALPKRIRRTFDLARAVGMAVQFIEANQDMSVPEAISRAVSSLGASQISPAEVANTPLPEHLRIRLSVVGEDGRVLAEGRDLPEVRRKVTEAVGDLQDRLRSKAAESWQRDGMTAWDVGQIPETVKVDTDAARGDVLGYPGLVDKGKTVSLLVHPTLAIAVDAHRAGVRRLFMLQSRRELRSLFRHEPGFDRLAARHALIGSREQLEDGLGAIACDNAFMHGEPIRDGDTFASVLDLHWSELSAHARDAIALASNIFARYAAIADRLEQGLPSGWHAVERDVRGQLASLVYPGFLTATPPQWLKHVPRYLAGAEHRISKLAGSGGGLAADDRNRALVQQHVSRLVTRATDNQRQGRSEPELIRYRWLIEELRVSLHAQQLGTAERVSPKRLDEAWSQIARSG